MVTGGAHMADEPEVINLARILIESFGKSAPLHADRFANMLKAGGRPRAGLYEQACSIAAHLIQAAEATAAAKG
jgi:hypothetical protein